MKSQSSIALKELLNESAKIVEEFQAQCILMATEFNELANGNYTSDFDYPTFTNEVKRIRYFATTVKKEVSSIDQIFKDVEVNEGNSYIDSLLVEMAKRTRKPLGQSFMKKVRHTFPETPYKNIRARIIHLIAEGKIIDYSELDTEKPKRGHPKTKFDDNQPFGNIQPQKLTEKLQQLQQTQQLQSQQLQQYQQMQRLQQQQLQQLQQRQMQQIQQQQQMQQVQQVQQVQQQIKQNPQNEIKADNSRLQDIDTEAMAEDLSSDLLSNHQFGSLNEILDDDSIGFETPFYQEVSPLTESPPQTQAIAKDEQENNGTENNEQENNVENNDIQNNGPESNEIENNEIQNNEPESNEQGNNETDNNIPEQNDQAPPE